MFENIAGIGVFKGVDKQKITLAFEQVRYQIREYEAENIIAYAGDTCEYLYVLLEGRVRGEMVNIKNQNVIVDDISAPNTFAEAFLFATQNKIAVNIVASTKAKIILLPREEFLKLLHLEPQTLENYLNAVSNRFVTVAQKLRFLTLKSVKKKIAHYLFGLARENKGKDYFGLGKTHAALASLFGITRPALTKNLLELQEEGVIEIKNKRVRILDKEKLVSY